MKRNLIKWLLIVTIILIGFTGPASADGRGSRPESGHHVSDRGHDHDFHGSHHPPASHRPDRLPSRTYRRHQPAPAPHHHGPVRVAERHYTTGPLITVHGLLPVPLPLPLPFGVVIHVR